MSAIWRGLLRAALGTQAISRGASGVAGLRNSTPGGTIRTSSVNIVTAANTINLPIPAGSAAGDYCVIFSSHGFNTIVPSGWTILDQPTTGSNWNGATFAKQLTAGDISGATVLVQFGGIFNGVIGCVVFNGAMTGMRAKASVRGANGAVISGALTTNGTPLAGDVGLYWSSMTPGPTAITLDRGVQLQTQGNGNSSAFLAKEALASGGAQTLNADYHGTVTGHYTINLIVQP